MHIRIFGRKGIGALKFYEKSTVLEQVEDISGLQNNMVYDLFEETVRAVEMMITPEDSLDCINMDTPEGAKITQEQNIFYVPTVIVYENDTLQKEIMFIENVGVMDPKTQMHDINFSSKWWDDLRIFLRDLDALRCQE